MNTIKQRLPWFLIVALLVVPIYFLLPHTAKAAYTYSRLISACQNSTCPSTQTNFTILVCANATMGNGNTCPTVTGLNQTGGGAHVQNSNGYDIVFSTVSDCSSGLLNWEMEKYVASTGEMEAWVLISSLSSSTTFYMCYGNSSISTFQGGSTGSAWDSNYAAVYHLPDGTTLSANDSTSNGNNGTLVNSPAANSGQIDGAAYLDGTNNRTINYGNGVSLQITGNITVSTWMNAVSFTNNGRVLAKQTLTNASPFVDYGLVESSTGITFVAAAGGSFNQTPTGSISTNAWHYVVGTYDGTTMRLYVDGSQVQTNTVSGAIANSTTNIISGFNTGTPDFNAYIDESRISNTNRSADWITTEYNNESNASNFETFGAETTNGGNTPTARLLIIQNATLQVTNASLKITGN